MTRSTSPMHWRAFTLVEVLIALMLTVLAAGLATIVLARQQRFYRGLDAITEVRARVRDGRAILIASVQTADVPDDTIRLAADTAIEFFSTIGASTVCAAPLGTTVFLPPDTLATGNTLTTWLSIPDTGDYALLFHDSSATAPTQGWERFRIVYVTTQSMAAACPPSSGFTTQGDVAAGSRAYAITLATPPSAPVRAGAPVRFIRRERYSVYRSSTDGQWYLGYRRCNAVDGVCGIIQPVSGPYRGVAGALPLSFRYYQRDGSELSGTGPTTHVARVDVVARGVSRVVLQLPGFPQVPFSDSGLASIAFRNRE